MQKAVDILSWLTLALYVTSYISFLLSIKKPATLSLISKVILIAGIALHLFALGVRSYYVGHAPMANLYETLLFFSFCVAAATAVYMMRYPARMIEVVTLPVVVWLILSAIKAAHDFTPLFLALKTIWFEIHVMASFAAYALFTVSFSSAIFFLIYYRRDRSRGRQYEEITNSANVWGFSFFSVAMFSGAIWAYLAWGNYWFWEPKTIWSFILWFYFAGIIHGHYLKSWRGKKVAIMTVIGFAVVIFTYIGVGLLMKSSHNL